LYRRLAETNPAYLPDVAMSLASLGVSLSQLGRQEDALASSQEAAELYRRLAETNPATYLPDLAQGLGAFAWVRARIGLDLPAALTAVEEAISIHEDLVKQLPEAFADKLLEMQGILADILDGLGRDTEAAQLRRRIAGASGDRADGL
jgi:tetratricopeptide (TPR) repeat protein